MQMGRAVAIAVALAGLGAAVLPAQEVFWDGFEYGDLCAWSNPPVTVTNEIEAFDESGANDDAGSAQTIGRCAVVEGTIGDPYDPSGQPVEFFPDTDFYEVNLQGPALLHLKLERIGGLSDFQAAGAVLNSYANYPDFGLTACDPVAGYPTVTTRQIYLPENGFVFADPSGVGSKQIPNNNKWYINVDDARNYDPCQIGVPPELIGDVNQTYRLTLSIDPLTGPPLAFPYAEEPVQMPADGSILIYRVDGATISSLDLVETFIDRTDPGRLDTKVYVVRKTGTTLTTVAGDDDFDTVDFFFDSRLQNVPLTANPHFVVVDHYGKYENGAIDLGLTIQYLPPF